MLLDILCRTDSSSSMLAPCTSSPTGRKPCSVVSNEAMFPPMLHLLSLCFFLGAGLLRELCLGQKAGVAVESVQS